MNIRRALSLIALIFAICSVFITGFPLLVLAVILLALVHLI